VEHELTILSPEKTILTYPLAGLGRRVAAHLLDVIIVVSVCFGTAMLGAMLVPWVGMLPFGLSMVVLSLLPFFYFILLEGFWNGRTVGKLATGLRVRMVDGTPIKFSAAVGRNFLRVADFFPMVYFTGVLAIFTTPRSQRVGDLLAGTVVVQEKRALPRFTPAPHKAGVHPFEERVGELRGMTPEEYVALKRFCDRFPELPPHIQSKLLDEVWHPIAIKRGVEAVPGVHPLYLAEATVMKYGRQHGLL
jgi:uncharacterized RDD family membrane protein YckC